MIDLKDLTKVKILQSNMRATFDNAHGKEVMTFLDQLCGWFDFHAFDTNQILIAHGKRQVLATIKTLLSLKPEEIVALNREEE